jgi:hypothetical protein
MVDPLDSHAETSVARGCGFAGLAIMCTMVGLAFDPSLAFKMGGFFCLSMSITLLFKAYIAPWTRYKDTELWVMLDASDRPPEKQAQWRIAAARRRACLKWADLSARFSVGLLAGALALRLLEQVSSSARL